MNQSHKAKTGLGLKGALPFSVTLVLIPVIVIMALDRLPEFIPWVIPWVVLPLVPFVRIAEAVFRKDLPNLDRNTPEARVFWHIAIIMFWAACYPFIVVFIIWAICTVPTLILYERIVLLVFCGQLGRLTTIASHDLIHRRQPWARGLGMFAMSALAMPHWYTEHVYMHHPNVATPRDKESARINQSYYNYFFTVLPYAYAEAIRTQARRLARRGLPFWHRSNPVWGWIVAWVAWTALALAIGGWWGLAAWLFVVLFAAWGMRAVDYIQHYGLQRILQPSGKYEKIQLHHSWNYSSSENYMYFSIQRHSDHHRRPAAPYPMLHNLPKEMAPALPASYGTMLTLTLLPSAWFRKMNPLVEKWRRDFYPEIRDWRALSSVAYRHRPDSADLISEIMSGAPCLAKHMERNYPLIDSIGSRTFQQVMIPKDIGMTPDELLVAQRGLMQLYYGHEFVGDEMIEDLELAQANVAEEIAWSSQFWCNDHAFQLGVRLMRGHLAPGQAGRPLSNMADAAVTLLSRNLLDEYISYHGPIAGDGIAVVALGRLGMRRMTFESRIELIFLSDDLPVSDGDSFVLDGHVDQFCRRFNKLAGHLSTNNLLLESASTRMPTSGTRNVTGTLARFANGDGDADDDFLLEVASARVVCASGDNVATLMKRFEDARRSVLLRHAASASDRPRMPTPRRDGRTLQAVLDGPGGLDDLERTVLCMRLRHIESHPDITLESSPVQLVRTMGERGILESQVAEEIAEAADFLLGLECALSLVKDGKTDETQWDGPVRATLARACDGGDIEDILANAEKAAARIAGHLDTLAAQPRS